ncbi:MAG: TRAP transporter small permease [Planctomycetota bacterium]|jgi:TRAP-type C4-dicarboxylate transport system permease small subunit
MEPKYKRFDNTLLKAIRITTALLLMIMFVVIFFAVLSRYALNSPAYWTEEFARYVMFYMVLIGSAAAARQKQHPALTFVIQEFPIRLRRRWNLIIDGLVFFVLIVVFWQGCVMAAEERIARTPALRISFFWVYLALPIGSLLMMLDILAKHITGTRNNETKSTNHSVAKEE